MQRRSCVKTSSSVRAAVLAATLAALTTIGLAEVNARRYAEATAWVRRSTTVQLSIASLEARVEASAGTDIEIRHVDEALRRELHATCALASQDSVQQARCARVEDALASPAADHATLRQSAVALRAIADEEVRLLRERRDAQDRRGRYASTLSALLTVALGALSFALLRRHLLAAQRDFLASEARFRAMADAANDLVTVCARDGAVLYVSPSVSKILGYSEEEFAALKPLEAVHPEDRAPLRAAVDALVDRGLTVLTFRVFDKAGATRWLETHFSALRDREGSLRIQCAARDVTERRAAECDLARSRELYRTLVRHIPRSCAMLFDEDLRFLVSDGVLLGALGLSRETTEGRTLAEISTPENVMVLERLCRAALAGEHGDADLDRAGLNVHVTVVPVRNAAGAAATGLMVLTDVTAQKAVEARLAAQAEQLTALSIRDELTGLLNRRGFLARAEEEAARAARTSSTFAIVFADLNGLKTINDTCGHEEGDAAIRAMGAVLTRSFRDTDVVARLGGDEFVVLVRDVEKEVVASLVERTRNEIANENAGGARLFRLSASIGSAESCRDTQTSVEDLLDAADRAMYEQKLRRRISTTPVIRVRAA